MSLRADIAARLKATGGDYHKNPGQWDRLQEFQDGFYLALADECIRQMEWAANQVLSSACGEDDCTALYDGISIAPEGWKP